MASVLGINATRAKAPALPGPRNARVQQASSAPAHHVKVSRREWWLWLSALIVTTLSAIAFSLTLFQSFFAHAEHFYEIRSDQVRWATLCLLLVFNSWLIYRQWFFRRLRGPALSPTASVSSDLTPSLESSPFDPVTGLYNRASFEQHIAKEIARSRRQNTTLSVATLHVDDLADIASRLGQSAVDATLKELARHLKKASRGSDVAARLNDDDFVLLLPECGVTHVKQVLNRVPGLEVSASGKRMPLTYTTGWVDYQPGDLPGDLLKRATSLLHLYDSASKTSFSAASH
jgi:diguanylate cyclase (GGDEF)-like protein